MIIIFSKPHTMIFFIFIFIVFLCSSSASSMAAELNDQTSILLSIKSHLIDPLDHLKDWKLSEEQRNPHCNWTGIVCNSLGGIEKLDLSRRNLSGKVSDEIQLLRSLVSIDLCGNGFSSPLPRSFSNLTLLQTIDLSQNYFVDSFPEGLGMAVGLTLVNASSNNFSGNIPADLGNNTGLETLDLRGNFFVGSIPVSFKNLRKLKFLGLSGNNLTGLIPKEIGELSALESIVLGYNEFVGGIPAEFGNLTNLKYLDLAYGNLGGSIPPELGNLKELEAMYLYKNNFRGKIPPEIGKLTSLTQLDLSDNMLSGEIPTEISALKSLQLFNVMSNRLTGLIPSGISNLTQLGILELWNNSFSGSLPDDLGFNSPLEWVDVSSNSFTGRIPESLCHHGNLTKLILFNNAFSGPITAGLSNCNSLVRVRMQNNFLSGMIPVGFGSLENLQRLELANNNLTGQIPNDISSSLSLSFIDFSQNQLQSALPSLIFSIPNLQNFLVSDNKLIGKIPNQFQDCPSLSILDLSSNQFTGAIPASIASCQKLVYLNLRNNQLSGEIPVPISMMGTLAVLDLSNNSLTGGIPENFGNSPALESLNVSYNRLQGPVPANGMLRTINPSDVAGNDGLCGNVLPPCIGNLVSHSRHKGLHMKHVIAGWVIGMSVLLAVLLAAFAGKALYDKWYTNGGCFEERFEMGKGDWPWRLMAFQKLNFNSNDILNCVKESNVIGLGATGVVYKAEIHRNNTVVAVKKLWSTKKDIELGSSAVDFVGEVNVLGKLRHRNIVRLLGFLYNDKNAMIVYEYMTNGSLGEALHGQGRLLVDWVLRYNIAVGVAQGLAYLHHDCHPPVIHRDVKPNNILLDENLEARIADFGLARMIVKNETVSMVAGSYGYIAPEYGYTLKVDEKSDIYSYGVVLMELITGKRPVEPEYGDSVDIIEWVRRKVQENKPLTEVIDPNVGNCKHVEEEMLLVLRIALICTARLPKDRPSMRDVISMLEEARPRRKSSSNTNNNGGLSSATNEKDRPVFSPSPVNDLL